MIAMIQREINQIATNLFSLISSQIKFNKAFSFFIMQTPTKHSEEHLPHIRQNRHFRIKSLSKEKILLGAELLTSRPKRKTSIDQTKRIFSDIKNRKSGSIDTCIKIKITKDELSRKFQKRPSTKKIMYECVKTDEGHTSEDSKLISTKLKTITHQQNTNTLRRLTHLIDPTHHLPKQQNDEAHLNQNDDQKWKKEKIEKPQKEHKGKYRCRVNQYIFDHSRKKSNLYSREQQETVQEFWKNVNESLILSNHQQEEASKDLRQFVDNFVTQ